MLPVAHAGHYLWVLYLIPIAIVVGSILVQLWRDRNR
jgi:hypothetical protein